MFEKLQQAFWRALTPDLVAEGPQASVPVERESDLAPEIVAALGGDENLKGQRRVALTRIRVELHDVALVDGTALRAAGVPGVMILAGNVAHLLVGLSASKSPQIL